MSEKNTQAEAPAQHPDDAAVDAFAEAMKEKLAQARAKGRGGWQTCPPEKLSRMLREHVQKGDPRDVANFCMFLWSLGQGIASELKPEPIEFLAEGTRFKMAFFDNEDDLGNPTGGTHVTCFSSYAKELDGRWVALVPAENDRHMKLAAPEAPAQATQQAGQWKPPPLTCPRSNRSDCALFGASIGINSAKESDHG